jgi:hypothetical protein
MKSNNVNLNAPISGLSNNWIISKTDDLKYLIAPAIASFLIIAIYYLLTRSFGIDEGLAVLVIYLSWAMLFDATHAFATYSRTYFDKAYYKENRTQLNKTLLVFLIGPAFILGIYALNFSVDQASMAFTIFNRFALCFAYYHLIRQHWGFIALYRKKNGEWDTLTQNLDSLLLLFGSVFPFASGQINNIQVTHIAETMQFGVVEWLTMGNYMFILGTVLSVLSIIPVIKKLDLHLDTMGILMLLAGLVIHSIGRFSIDQVLGAISIIAAIGFILTSLVYLYHWYTKPNVTFKNFPKWLLLFAVLFTYNIAFHLGLPIFILYAAVTVFHNIQYHKIVHFHNVNKYQASEEKKYGFAVTLTQKLLVFITLAILFNLVSYVPRIASAQMETLVPNYILSTLFWGVAFHHYVLDAVIWRIRKDKQLTANLNIHS